MNADRSSRAPRLVLRVLRGPLEAGAADRDQMVEIPDMGGTVGRGVDCTLVLPDPACHVSRVQAEIGPLGAGWGLRDRGSALQTLVRGLPAGREDRPTPLADGDLVAIGDWELRAEIGDAPAWAAPDEIGRTVYAWKVAGGAIVDFDTPLAGLSSTSLPPPSADPPSRSPHADRSQALLGLLLRELAEAVARLPEAPEEAGRPNPLRAIDPLAALMAMDDRAARATLEAAFDRLRRAAGSGV